MIPQLIKERWNQFADDTGVSPIRKLSETRLDKLRTRWEEWEEVGQGSALATYFELLEAIREQPFLLGKTDDERGWTITFDWLIRNDTHWLKILERSFQGQQRRNGPQYGM